MFCICVLILQADIESLVCDTFVACLLTYIVWWTVTNVPTSWLQWSVALLINSRLAGVSTERWDIGDKSRSWNWCAVSIHLIFCTFDFTYMFMLLRQCRREGGGRPGRAAVSDGTLQGTAFEGRKFGILAFALQCVSVSLYLCFIYSIHWEWVLPVGRAAPRTFAQGGKNTHAATALQLYLWAFNT